MEQLACDRCFEDFDDDIHRPKILSCGHSMCSLCVRNGSSCVWDIQDTVIDVANLKDDCVILWSVKNRDISQPRTANLIPNSELGAATGRSKLLESLRSIDLASDLLDREGVELLALFKRIRVAFQRVRDEIAVQQRDLQDTCNRFRLMLNLGGRNVDMSAAAAAAECASSVRGHLELLGGSGGSGGSGSHRLHLTLEEEQHVNASAALDLTGQDGGLDGGEADAGRLLLFLLLRSGKLSRDASTPERSRSSPDGMERPEECKENARQAVDASTQTDADGLCSESEPARSSLHPIRVKVEEGHMDEGPDSPEVVVVEVAEVALNQTVATNAAEDSGRRMMQLMYYQLHENPYEAFSVPASVLNGNSALAEEISQSWEIAMFVLKEELLRKTMAELRAARWFSLCVDTLPISDRSVEHSGLSVVAMIVRYCLSTGEPVERLIALVDSRTATGEHLFHRFNSLCQLHGVDWAKTLCGFSMDTTISSQKAFYELLQRLRLKARQVFLCWNGAHRLWDLIAVACRCHEAGRHFFETLEALGRFFSQSGRALMLYQYCGGVLGGLSLDTYEGIILLLSRAFSGVRAVLFATQRMQDESGLVASFLLSAILQVEFLSLLFLFNAICDTSRQLEGLLDFSGTSCLGDLVILSLEDVKSKISVVGLSGFFSRAEKSAHSFTPAPLPYDQDSVMSALESLSQSAVDVIDHRFSNSILVLRDLEAVATMTTLDPDNSVYQALREALVNSQRGFCRELVTAAVRARQPGCEVRSSSSRDAIMGLATRWEREQFAREYPHLCEGLQLLCALPLLPPRAAPRAGLWKLRVLREALQRAHGDLPRPPMLEAKMVAVCWADGPVQWDTLPGDVADQAFGDLLRWLEALKIEYNCSTLLSELS